MHLALAAPSAVADAQRTVLLCGRAAARTPLGLVEESLLGVELLLASRKDEVHPAVTAADGLVGVHPTHASCSHARTGALDGLLVPLPGRSACDRLPGSSRLAGRFAGDDTRGYNECKDVWLTLDRVVGPTRQ